MKTPVIKIAAMLSANAIGFFALGACYILGLKSGLISSASPDFDAATFKTWFLGGTLITWAICGIFSVAYLFLKDRMRFIFLLAPIIVPLIYGFSVLYSLPSL